MKISPILKIVLAVIPVVAATLVLCDPAAAAKQKPRTVAGHTKEQAERNLLHATRVLGRWHVGLVNGKTGLLRQNTTATCHGVGHRFAGRYHTFRCQLRHGTHRVNVRYLALARNGFEVRRLSK